LSTPTPPPYGRRPDPDASRQQPGGANPQADDAGRAPDGNRPPPPYPDSPGAGPPPPPYQPPYRQPPPYQPYPPPGSTSGRPPMDPNDPAARPTGPHNPDGPGGAPPGPVARRVNVARLWVGGLATALVAALASLVCVLLVRGVLHVPVFAPRGEGTWGNLTTSGLALAAAGAALAATLLMHLLLLAAPQPGTFFAWIITLATIAVILLAFTTSLRLSSQIGSAAVYAVVGLTVGWLVSAVGRSAARGPAAADYRV
jgi:hypothetical protein